MTDTRRWVAEKLGLDAWESLNEVTFFCVESDVKKKLFAAFNLACELKEKLNTAERLVEQPTEDLRRDEMSDDEPKLKRCPFCGGVPQYSEIENDENVPNAGGEYIECIDCGCSTVVMFSVKEDAKTHLIERWNRRTRSKPHDRDT